MPALNLLLANKSTSSESKEIEKPVGGDKRMTKKGKVDTENAVYVQDYWFGFSVPLYYSQDS